MWRTRGLIANLLLVTTCACASGHTPTQSSESTNLVVRIVDANGKMTPARAWVEIGDRRFYQPIAPETAIAYPKDRSLSCNGTFTISIPVGNAVVHVEKGKEYTPIDLPVTVTPGRTFECTIPLTRWIDLPSEGWYSADLHVHLGNDDTRVLRQLALADDVHLLPAITYWLRGLEETWESKWPDPSFTDPIAVDAHHIITRNNIELERIRGDADPGATIGATLLFNLDSPVTASQYGEHYPTDAALCRRVRIQSPRAVIDSDKPSWPETVLNAAIGTIDTMQLCHNHYHRNTTLRAGWGMIGPLSTNDSNTAAGDSLFHRTNDLYYRFLNCGFRLGVSAGSAIGVMPVPTGHNRVYARIDGPLTAESMWAAIKAGHTFATTGPILMLEVDGHGPGATISRSSSNTEPIKIKAILRSIDALESLQLVHNGHVVASLSLLNKYSEPVLQQLLSYELKPKRSGWIAARTLYRASDGLLRQAHTSPIYLSVDEKPTAFSEDASYMLRWIAILNAIAREQPDRFPSVATQQEVLADYEAARIKYERVIDDATRYWAD